MYGKFMMKVNGCCCCFNLRTGTQILFILGIVQSLSYILQQFSGSHHNSTQMYVSSGSGFSQLIWQLIPCAMGLYGIYARKPEFLKPYVIINFICVVILWIFAALLILLWLVATHYLKEVIKEYNAQQEGKPGHGSSIDADSIPVGTIIAIFLVIIAFISWLNLYFASVVHHFRKQMKEESGPNHAAYHAADYHVPPKAMA